MYQMVADEERPELPASRSAHIPAMVSTARRAIPSWLGKTLLDHERHTEDVFNPPCLVITILDFLAQCYVSSMFLLRGPIWPSEALTSFPWPFVGCGVGIFVGNDGGPNDPMISRVNLFNRQVLLLCTSYFVPLLQRFADIYYFCPKIKPDPVCGEGGQNTRLNSRQRL